MNKTNVVQKGSSGQYTPIYSEKVEGETWLSDIGGPRGAPRNWRVKISCFRRGALKIPYSMAPLPEGCPNGENPPHIGSPLYPKA
eukprot:scaffold8471_cov124-Skeletonema_marinoi.AAC.6